MFWYFDNFFDNFLTKDGFFDLFMNISTDLEANCFDDENDES